MLLIAAYFKLYLEVGDALCELRLRRSTISFYTILTKLLQSCLVLLVTIHGESFLTSVQFINCHSPDPQYYCKRDILS